MEHFFVSTRALIMQKMSLLGDILSYNFFIWQHNGEVHRSLNA
jgi:hypothetical protein